MRRPLCISIAVLIILFPYLTCLAVFERPAGDLTGDFLVNMDDLFDFASRWLDAMGGPADLYLGEGVTLSDFAVLAENWGADARPVLITEFMAANGSSLPLQPGELLDSDGDASDWLELHNPGDAAVEIGGCYLTDDPDNPKKWRFPDGLQLESGQYLVVFASGKDRAVAGRPLHTSFSLRADGEYLALVASDGRTVLHEYASHLLGGGLFGFPPQERNVSYGLYENRERYFALPTPGAANDPIYIGFVGDLDVSPGRGIRHAAFTATLSINTADAVIRYTTDGSEPSVSNGTTYTQPIEVSTTTTLRAVAIKTGWRPSKIATHTYIFPMDVRTQKAPLDYPTVWSGYPADYVMDPEICTAGEYRNDIVPALTSIPTLSIVTHKNNLFSPIYNATTGGIYAYPGHSSTGGLGWERPTSVEYLNTPDGSEFQIDCGIRIYGGENRNPQKCPKHSFRLLFKGQYGPTKLKFPLFGKDAAQQFDTLLLRGGFNNSWIHWDSNQRLRSQYIHDQWVRDTQLAMGQVAAHGVYVHLYLNGLYWGIYNITERPDTSFAASYYGGEKEEWDALNSSVPTGDGSKTSWKTAQTIANTHNISTPEGYAALAEQVDIDNLIDYMIVNLHSGNMDWDDHNWYAAKRRVDGEGFKFFCWDSERTLENAYGDNRVNINQSDKPSRLYTALRQNAEFRLDFADHVHRHFANHGALTPKAAKQRWLTRARELDMAIIAESARWGDYRRDLHPYSSGPYHLYTKFDHWLPEQMRLLNAYFPVRTDVVMGFFRNAGLYPSVDPPRFWVGGLVQHGGTIPIGQPIALGQPAGTAYYTLDGSDPRLGGLPYTGPFTLVRSAVVKTRLRSGAQWSALNEAVFTVGPVPQSLRITELMYHPWTDPNVLSPEPEFVELANIGAQAINLNLCRFTKGIDFTFGDLSLAPGARTVVVNNRAIFEAAYPGFTGTIAGEYTGSLDNSGERITLLDAIGQTIHNFTYSDGWYDITDGGGFSLTIKDPTRSTLDHVDGNLAGHWKLDEFGGAAAADASGNGRSGVLRGDPQWRSDGGRINGAIELDGDGDYVEITNYKGVLGSGPRTCVAWIKTTGQNVAIAGWGMVDPTGTRWAMVVDAAGRLRQEFGGGFVLGTKIINDGKWHHVAVVLDGPRSDDAVLYVDGCRETISEMVSLSVNTQAGPNAAIGAHLGMNRYFNGLLDNVCIYERALSAEEVALLAAAADYWEDKQYWRPSAHVGGSPGEDDTGIVPEPGAVVINELLAHSHAAQPDWVELHNTTGEAIDIGGWFLSDSKNDYMKFRIADNTILAPYGYAVFYESLHFNNTQNPGCLRPFAFSENGEACYVRSGLDARNQITGFYNDETFGASPTGVAFGRWQKSTGAYNFVAMSENTPGAANAYPKVGPIVISEIMYNPLQGAGFEGKEHEYVELHNISGSPVTLQEYDPVLQINVPWRFTDGIDYTFAPNTTIPAGGYLVVAKNLTAFAARHGVLPNVVGPYGGQLDNAGEKLELSMPGDTDDKGTRYYIRIDRVNYNDSADWPAAANGQGMSLTRISSTEYGNDIINWQAADPTPGG